MAGTAQSGGWYRLVALAAWVGVVVCFVAGFWGDIPTARTAVAPLVVLYFIAARTAWHRRPATHTAAPAK